MDFSYPWNRNILVSFPVYLFFVRCYSKLELLFLEALRPFHALKGLILNSASHAAKLIGLQRSICVLYVKILKKTFYLAITYQILKHSGMASFILKILDQLGISLNVLSLNLFIKVTYNLEPVMKYDNGFYFF